MTKYMIHAMPKRMWYVSEYLIPSMLEQGINEADIRVHNDSKKEGNLKSCMHAFQEVDTTEEGTWHLQDDVIISHDFKEQTELYDTGIVCGFSSMYDDHLSPGHTSVEYMWFSFPCIRIPNKIAIECAEWCLKYIIGNPIYPQWWENGVNDDLIFRRYVWDTYKKMPAINLNPNIVDHIDYLIGGTVNSSKRSMQIRSRFWQDEYLVEELEKKLKERI